MVLHYMILNHHYLPQVYLRQFKAKGSSPLFVFDKVSGCWAESTVKNAGSIPNLYSWLNSDGTSDDRVEKFFGRIETTLRPFYKELRKGNVTQCSAAPFKRLLSSLAIRVPDHIENIRVSEGAHLNSIFEQHRDEIR